MATIVLLPTAVAIAMPVDHTACSCSDMPWQLFADEGRHGVDVSGWAVAGFTANAHGNRTGLGNAPMGMNNVADGPVLNQLWIAAEKAVDTSGCGTDWGFKLDYLFGADGPDNQAFGGRGWDFGWNSSRDYGSAILNAYVELGFHDLTAKAGHFATLLGWELSSTPDNFFYSHTLMWYYGEPNSHTGVLATLPLGDAIEAQAGWTMGWDGGFENYLNASTFLGAITWTMSERAMFYWAVVAGDHGDGTAKNAVPSNSGDIYLNSFVIELQIADELTYTVWHDFAVNRLPGADTKWYGVNQWLTYDVNNCWSIGGRFEWFRDDDGARVFVNSGGAGSYYATTLTANWQPRRNVTIRPELRWDWFDGPGFPYDSRDGGVTGTSRSMFTAGGAVVVMF